MEYTPETKVSEWFAKERSFETTPLPENLTFGELSDDLEFGINIYDVFTKLGYDIDSPMRESIFEALSQIYPNKDYNYWHEMWLDTPVLLNKTYELDEQGKIKEEHFEADSSGPIPN